MHKLCKKEMQRLCNNYLIVFTGLCFVKWTNNCIFRLSRFELLHGTGRLFATHKTEKANKRWKQTELICHVTIQRRDQSMAVMKRSFCFCFYLFIYLKILANVISDRFPQVTTLA